MTGFRVDVEQLGEIVDQMARYESQLQEALDDIDGQIARLHGTWSGAAAQAQLADQQRWRDGADRMHAALVVMRQIAATAQQNYTDAATTNARMWQL